MVRKKHTSCIYWVIQHSSQIKCKKEQIFMEPEKSYILGKRFSSGKEDIALFFLGIMDKE